MGLSIQNIALTMHAEQDTHLLESFGAESPRRAVHLIVLQVSNDLPDSIHIFGKFGIICLVPLLNLGFSGQSM